MVLSQLDCLMTGGWGGALGGVAASKHMEGSERHLSLDWPNSPSEIDCGDAKLSASQLWAPSVVSVATLNFLLPLKQRALRGGNGSRSGEGRGEGRKSRSVSSEDEWSGRGASTA